MNVKIYRALIYILNDTDCQDQTERCCRLKYKLQIAVFSRCMDRISSAVTITLVYKRKFLV